MMTGGRSGGNPGASRIGQAAKQAARRKKRLALNVRELFEHRYVFVQRHLTASEPKTLAQITRGQPQLRSVRRLMEEVYRLFDRRCRLIAALTRLAKLRV
jgi:hypothetical protein